MKTPFLAVLLVLLGALSACSESGSTGVAAAKKTPRQPHLVETTTVAPEKLAYSTERTGTLYARREVRLFNQEEGRIDAVSVHEGDPVKAGGVLLRLDDALLRAQLQKAVATRRQAESDLARVQRLADRQLVAADELSRARTGLEVARAEELLLRTRLGYTVLRAPFDGLVTERNAEPGDVAPLHSHLLTLIDPKSLYTEVAVSELLLPLLRPGDPVQVHIDALPEHPVSGRVVRIHPAVDPATRQGVIEVSLDTIPRGAAVGALCRVRLGTQAEDRLVIPFGALRRDTEGEYVYVVGSDMRAHRRTVQSGLRLDRRVEILHGLRAGDQVVVKGFLGLSDDRAVRLPSGEEARTAGLTG